MSKADLLEAWGEHLAKGRRRSPHTVRAYLAAAARLLDRTAIELRVGDGAVHLRARGKSIEVASGPADRPELVVTSDATTLLGVAAGKLSLVDAVGQGLAEVAGDEKSLRSASAVLRAGRS